MAIKPHLRDKRNEIIWALLAQGYNYAEVSQMFSGVGHRASILRIARNKPKNYKPKWVKVRE